MATINAHATSYPTGTRGLDARTAARLATPLHDRLNALMDHSLRCPVTPAEVAGPNVQSWLVTEEIHVFADGDVLWLEIAN